MEEEKILDSLVFDYLSKKDKALASQAQKKFKIVSDVLLYLL